MGQIDRNWDQIARCLWCHEGDPFEVPWDQPGQELMTEHLREAHGLEWPSRPYSTNRLTVIPLASAG